jgi:hypothetical protein
LAATFGAVLGDDDDPERPVPELIFNIDATGLELERDYVAEALITEEVKTAVAEHNLSVTITAPKRQYRSAKAMTLVNAAGSLCSTMVIIKDREFKEAEVWEVRNTKQPFCLTNEAARRASALLGTLQYDLERADGGHSQDHASSDC